MSKPSQSPKSQILCYQTHLSKTVCAPANWFRPWRPVEDELLCSQLLPLWNEISVWAEPGEHHDYRVPAKLSIITNSCFHCCCAPVQNRSLSPT